MVLNDLKVLLNQREHIIAYLTRFGTAEDVSEFCKFAKDFDKGNYGILHPNADKNRQDTQDMVQFAADFGRWFQPKVRLNDLAKWKDHD